MHFSQIKKPHQLLPGWNPHHWYIFIDARRWVSTDNTTCNVQNGYELVDKFSLINWANFEFLAITRWFDHLYPVSSFHPSRPKCWPFHFTNFDCITTSIMADNITKWSLSLKNFLRHFFTAEHFKPSSEFPSYGVDGVVGGQHSYIQITFVNDPISTLCI